MPVSVRVRPVPVASQLRVFDVNVIRHDSALYRLAAFLRLSVCLFLTVVLASAPAAASADMLTLPLAQAAQVKPPANVRKVGRLYVVEGVVVVALFGGALYAVCRSSRRT